jgi:hypothetical protein
LLREDSCNFNAIILACDRLENFDARVTAGRGGRP